MGSGLDIGQMHRQMPKKASGKDSLAIRIVIFNKVFLKTRLSGFGKFIYCPLTILQTRLSYPGENLGSDLETGNYAIKITDEIASLPAI